MLKMWSEERNAVVYSYFARCMNTVTLKQSRTRADKLSTAATVCPDTCIRMWIIHVEYVERRTKCGILFMIRPLYGLTL